MKSEADRDRVCDAYDKWLRTQIEERNPAVLLELERLATLARKSDITLGCFCAPKRCHAESIKREVEKLL